MMRKIHLTRMYIGLLAALPFPGWGFLFAGEAGIEPLVEVRIGPPRQVVDNAMAIARRVQPGIQTEMLPALFLSAFGYPQFADFEPLAPIHLCAFADDQDPDGLKWVGLAPLREGSKSLRWLRSRGMVVEHVDGWALFYSSPPLAAEREAVLGRADEVGAGDISWTIRPRQLAVDEMRERILVALRLKMTDPAQVEAIEPTVDVLLEAMNGIDSLTMGLDLADGAVEMSFHLRPQGDSLLYGLLHRPLSTANDGSVAIGSGGLVEFRGRFPQQAWLVLTRWMLEFGAALPAVAAVMDATLTDTLLELAERLDGTGAGVMAFHGDGSLKEAMVAYAADFSFDDLVEWRELLMLAEPQWATRLQGADDGAMIDRQVTTGEIDGHPYLRFETAVRKRLLVVRSEDYLAATEALRSGQTDPDALAAFGQVEESTLRMVSYETVVDGAVVMADSPAAMMELARRVAQGEVVDNNLRSALPMAANDLFFMRVDVGQLPLIDWVPEPTPTTERMIRQFRATKHQPLEFKVYNDGGVWTAAVTLPVSSLTAVSRLRKGIEQLRNAEGQQVQRIPF